MPLELLNSDTIGVDEAGRGALIGRVYAGAVIMPEQFTDEIWKQIKDSKKLTPKKRGELRTYIENTAITWGVGWASEQEVDDVNILQATHKAMFRALDNAYLKTPFNSIVIDGDCFKAYTPPNKVEWLSHRLVENGDNIYLNIASASILAKEYHDDYIKELVKNRPELQTNYALLNNKGYGTKLHMEGLKQWGASQFHRKSFAPVRRVI